MSVITGDKQIMATLAELSKPTARRRAMMAGLRPAAKEGNKVVKNQIPSEYKEVRKAVKWRALKVKESKEAAVKLGAGVGKKRTSAKQRGDRPGVGISANNIHWWFLGTAERTTDSGKSIGAMPAQEDPIAVMVTPAVSKMLNAAREGVKKGVAKEVAKARAKR